MQNTVFENIHAFSFSDFRVQIVPLFYSPEKTVFKIVEFCTTYPVFVMGLIEKDKSVIGC